MPTHRLLTGLLVAGTFLDAIPAIIGIVSLAFGLVFIPEIALFLPKLISPELVK